MIPYFESQTFHILGITFHTWGTLVALGFGLGTYVAWRRAKEKGLDPDKILDLAFWIFIGAFVCARLFEAFFYDHALLTPMRLFDPRLPGWSMFGGFIGAALVFFLYCRRHALKWIEYADVLVWGLPWGCGVGRIGCFLIHDHPGTLTNFVLGVKYSDGSVRHDLGLYLSLIGFATGLGFLWFNRKQRKPGFWFGSFMIVEGVTRFVLDFLRIADATYFGLTPTQYLSVPMIAVGVWMVYSRHVR